MKPTNQFSCLGPTDRTSRPTVTAATESSTTTERQSAQHKFDQQRTNPDPKQPNNPTQLRAWAPEPAPSESPNSKHTQLGWSHTSAPENAVEVARTQPGRND